MKFTVDVPSVGTGVVLGFLLSAASIRSGWFLNYDGIGEPVFFGAFGLLLFSGIWLTTLRRPFLPAMTLRVNSFQPVARDTMTGAKSAMASEPDLNAPSQRPSEWLCLGTAGMMPAMPRAVARNLLVAQLRGPASLGMLQAMMLAVRADQQPGASGKGEIDNLSALVWHSFLDGPKPDFAKFCAELLTRHPGLDVSARFEQQHHFAATRLLAEIAEARANGLVLPAASFRWAKAFDRGLFYAINNLGRTAMFVEGAGISSHYAAEKHAGHGIAEPAIEIAVEGVGRYLKMHGLIAAALWDLAAE